MTPPSPARLPRLMLVTDRRETAGRDLVDVVAAAVAGGVGLVQVRERDLDEADLAALLRRLADRLRDTPARLLVNAHPALARSLGIGLHLPAAAPRPASPAALLGRAAHDEREVQRAVAEGAAYIVVGPVFPTTSKPGHLGTGVEELGRLARAAAGIPVFAIGGLTPARVSAVVTAGAHGAAVRSALLGAADPAAAARAFLDAFPGPAARP